MSWLDEFFNLMGAAPIVTTFGPVPSISITPATDTAAGSMSAADKTKLDGLAAASVPLFALASTTGSTGQSPLFLGALVAGVDYPTAATSCVLKATLWCDKANSPASWSATTYSAGDIFVNPDGGGTGNSVVYVVTTGGSASGTHGPVGFGAGLQDQGGSLVRYRSQTASIVFVNALTSATYAATNSMTLAAAFASSGAALVEISLDVTAHVIGQSPTVWEVGVNGDPADVGGTKYTVALAGNARLIFT